MNKNIIMMSVIINTLIMYVKYVMKKQIYLIKKYIKSAKNMIDSVKNVINN